MCMCVCMPMCAGACEGRNVGCPGARVTGSYEPPDMRAGNWMQVLSWTVEPSL